MAECGYCGGPLPPRRVPPDKRKYCSDAHKNAAYLLRKAEGVARLSTHRVTIIALKRRRPYGPRPRPA